MIMHNLKNILVFIFLIIIVPSFALGAGFDPNLLISDERFSDIKTLGGAEGIQKFLESQGSVLSDISPAFLTKLREPGDENLKSRLPDPRPNLGRLRSAAELIHDASTASGLNPQVVLVTLQKEQSLINKKFTTDRDLTRALDRALGFGCPDEGGCGDIFLGFYHQLFGNFDAEGNRYIGMPASLMRSFNFEVSGQRVGRGPMVDASGNAYIGSPRVRTARKGETITLDNTQGPPNNAEAKQMVTLSNFATTALYRYTPHVYNGNYNFWKFFTQWFLYPDGTLLQTTGQSQIYILDSGLARPISEFVINQRGLKTTSIVVVSPGELASYPQGGVMLPLEGSVLKSTNGSLYIIENQTKKLLSSFVAIQRKIALGNAVIIPDSELATYKDGGRALPLEGTLVKSMDNPAVYIITNNEKRLLTGFVFQNRGLFFSNVLTAEPGELDVYPNGKVMPPKDGSILKKSSHPTVYHVGNGILEPLTYFVFTARKFNFRDMVVVPDSEFVWEIGKVMPPPTGILVKGKNSPAVYYIESGVKRHVSYDVFLVRKFSFRDVIIAEEDQLAHVEPGESLFLPERALVKVSDNPGVYYVVDGLLRPLTLQAFNNRLLRFADVVTISKEEFAKYQIGAMVEN